MRTIDVLGFISSFGYWSDEISPRYISRQLKEANGEDVHIRINSPGGDAFAGIAIYNQLKSYKGSVNIEVIGLAASAASIIALGGEELVIKKGAMMMIHEPVAFTIGDAARHETTAASLRKLIDSLVDVYTSESSEDLDKDEIKTEMSAETWYTAQEAVDKGWASSIDETDDKDEKDTKKNVRQALTMVRDLWHNPDRIPGALAGLLSSTEPDDTEVTNNVDKADEKRLSQLEAKVDELTNKLADSTTKLAAKNEAIAALTEQNKGLLAKIGKAEASALDAKVNAKLDEAQKDGRLAKADRDKWAKRLKSDFDEFAEILDEQPKAVNTGDPAGSSGDEGGSPQASGDDIDLDDPVHAPVAASMREGGYTDKQIKEALGDMDSLLGEGGDSE